ncbi:paar repeat-containing protein [Massilia sp. S19_KUP03_FR1]|uniref:paar repeat-containing protein n=1 Tax=Massilia sp. S19_KUP03_FR1 TaxID=3025503 RepID=UPI002FCDB03A
MTARTLTSPSGRTLHYVASRRTTPAEDSAAKELRILASKQKRLAENREYLKNGNVRAYLAAIAAAEGGDYNLMYGGVIGKKNDRWRFSDFSTHPGPGIDGRTTAAWRYQINMANWKENGEKKMGLTDFSAETQDLIAVESIRYAHAIDDVIAGDVETAARKSSKVWAAIPKGPGIPNDAGQPYMRYEKFLGAFTDSGGTAR